MSPRISGVRSATTFGSLSAGSSTSLMPARFAPSTFSFTPPIGRTTPESVISPLIASRSFTGRPLSKLTSAVTIAAPADGPSFGTAPRVFARNRRDLALQVAHARFSGEAVDNLLQALVRELDLLADFQAMFLGLLGDQVLVRDVQLLFACVSRQFDDLHAVPQRLRDGIHPVRRGDEQHFREIERHIQIVISER